MFHLSPILASSDDSGRFVGFLIFAVIAVISWISSWINKQKEQQKRRQADVGRDTLQNMAAIRLAELQRERLRRQQGRAPAPVPARQARQSPVQRRISASIARRAPDVLLPAPPRRTPSRRPPPLPKAPVAPAPTATAPQAEDVILMTDAGAGVSPGEIGSSTERFRQQPAGAHSATIKEWLTPASLRRQFILTEIFQPPVALRE